MFQYEMILSDIGLQNFEWMLQSAGKTGEEMVKIKSVGYMQDPGLRCLRRVKIESTEISFQKTIELLLTLITPVKQ